MIALFRFLVKCLCFSSLIFVFPQLSFSQLYTNDVYYKDLVFERGDSLLGNNLLDRVYGDVVFKHKDITFKSDSAYHFKDEGRFDGYGNVHIIQGDSIDLYGDSLFYFDALGIVEVIGHVIFKDKETTLYTDYLMYETVPKIANYNNGAEVIDGENTLNSMIGVYHVNEKQYEFKDAVVIRNPTYTLYSDTLNYNSLSSIASVVGPTNIISKDKHLYAEKGEYHSLTKKAYFNQNSIVETPKYILRGDSLFYDEILDNGYAYKNVAMKSKTDSLVVFGQRAYRWGYNGYSEIYDSAFAIKYDANDSLFLKSDTLLLIDDSVSINDYLKAYENVSFYRYDFKCIRV